MVLISFVFCSSMMNEFEKYSPLFSYLVRPKEEMELRKWASEGLSFISLDADVKVCEV